MGVPFFLFQSNEQQSNSVENSIILQSQIMQSPSILASFLDARVPFPRTTGAHFNAVGKSHSVRFDYGRCHDICFVLGILVCFFRSDDSDGQAPSAAQTPRSYSALANFAREPRSYFSIKNTDYSLKSYYQREWRVRYFFFPV